MNKELLLQVVSEVIDRGGSVSIQLSQFNMGKEWPWDKTTESYAFKLANQFKEAVGSKEIERNEDKELPHLGDFVVAEGNIRGCFTFFNNLIEDVDLSGSENPLPFADPDYQVGEKIAE